MSKSHPKSHDQNKDEPTSLAFLMKPTYLIAAACTPLLLGAYAGYRSELSRAASTSASSADSYSPGLTSSGGGLLKRVIGEEILSNGIGNRNNTPKAVSAVTETGELAKVPNVNIPRLAFKALGFGTILSIGGFGVLTFGKYSMVMHDACCSHRLQTKGSYTIFLSFVQVVFKATGSDTLDELIEKCRKWTPNKRKQLEHRFGIVPKSMQHEDVKATKGMTEDEEWEFLKKKYIPELVRENTEDNKK